MTVAVNAGWCAEFCAREMADHRARLIALENERAIVLDNQNRLSDKLDKLQFWMMSTLVAAVGGILAQLLHR